MASSELLFTKQFFNTRRLKIIVRIEVSMDKFFMQKPFALTTNKFRNNFLLEESISLKNANLYYNNNTDLLIVKGNLSKIIMVGYLLDITDSTLTPFIT